MHVCGWVCVHTCVCTPVPVLVLWWQVRWDRKQQRVSHRGMNHNGPGTPES